MAPSYLGDFTLRGAELRKKGINRIGNLLVPNNNYCQLEEWILPVWDKMLEEQNAQVPEIFSLNLLSSSRVGMVGQLYVDVSGKQIFLA